MAGQTMAAMAVADKNVAIGRNHDAACAVDLVKAMGMSGISKSQVSRLCEEIDEVQDPDILTLHDALIEMGRHFYDAWDTLRVCEFLKDADERLAKLSTAGAALPDASRLRAAARELAGDNYALHPDTRKRAEQSYLQALNLLGRHRKIIAGGELALARVHRKLATLKMMEDDYSAASTHVEAATPLLDSSEEAPYRNQPPVRQTECRS
jgi:hypothetical protein